MLDDGVGVMVLQRGDLQRGLTWLGHRRRGRWCMVLDGCELDINLDLACSCVGDFSFVL